MDGIGIYTKEVRSRHKLLTRDEETELAAAAQAGDKRAQETLLYSIMPMVISIAKRFQGRGLDLEDLVQAGNLGAMRSIETFAPERGRLTTYATHWIKQKICYAVENGSLIHVPAWLFDKAKSDRTSPEERLHFQRLKSRPASIDASLHGRDDDGASLAEFVEQRGEHPIDGLIDAETRAELFRNISRLSEREQLVIRGRLAGKTHSQLGAELGVSRARAHQIDVKAMTRLAWLYAHPERSRRDHIGTESGRHGAGLAHGSEQGGRCRGTDGGKPKPNTPRRCAERKPARSSSGRRPASLDPISIYLRDIRLGRLLTAEEERETVQRARAGDQAARETLIRSVLPLVVSLARKRSSQPADLQDLIQAGNVGVIIAVGKFDPERGARLITYAHFWILQQIRYHEKTRGNTIRMPINWHYRDLSPEAREEMDRIRGIVSLEEEVYQSKNSRKAVRLYDTLADLGTGPVESAATRETVIDMRRRIDRMKERYQQILLWRADGLTLEQVGRKLGVSRERARQLQKQALRELAGSFGVFEPNQAELEGECLQPTPHPTLNKRAKLETGLRLLAEGKSVREINREVGYSPNAHWFADEIKRKMRLLLSQGLTPEEIGKRLGANVSSPSWAKIADYLKRLKATPVRSSNKRGREAKSIPAAAGAN